MKGLTKVNTFQLAHKLKQKKMDQEISRVS